MNGGSTHATSPTTITGLTAGHIYTYFVRACNGDHTLSATTCVDSNQQNSPATFTCQICTAPQTNPYYTCSNSTCVPNTDNACGQSDTGCTAAGGSCQVQAGNTSLTFTIGLDGIGHTGDNVNADWTAKVQAATQFTQANTSGSNQNPLTATRPLTVQVFDKNNTVATYAGTMTYDSTSGLFTSTADLGANFVTGNYSIKVSTDGHLVRLVPGPLQTITAGIANPMPRANLVAGDIDIDNALNIQDYNILMSCINDPIITNPDNGALCAANANYAKLSDLYDNGVIDNRDYNLFLREYSVQNGD
jgi:hypothetical protein